MYRVKVPKINSIKICPRHSIGDGTNRLGGNVPEVADSQKYARKHSKNSELLQGLQSARLVDLVSDISSIDLIFYVSLAYLEQATSYPETSVSLLSTLKAREFIIDS
jgi:hypothetical protein